ncbi:MAG: alpha/beta hydrolase [Verrucomicrobia bacterium]|nr:alpha/beta hydrolase [Verrucomicrobiota bacterium]MBU4247227.1 alpha/beta hydrolase [Verrucomicrobiota bacterium]MBU4289967.1 alpha/beta hydrolase [Verrucomicrobiota bacterium]MBU4498038.1 alpha/beta hydrolase [Verrucomicrobiota bacterium]MCG2679685.1 alpha/beta hydrolase [Kiritimatiellia bacterium]
MNSVSILHILWSALRIGLAVYIGLCLLMFIFQSHYVYFPSREILATPAAVALPFEAVMLTANGGQRLATRHERIATWFVPASSARGTVLVCHGNGGNIGDRLHIIQRFHELGLNVFIFDYRGYGQSQGAPSEKRTYEDALAAWNYLTRERRLPPDRIIVCGRSLGGAVAAWLADKQKPAGLILESTFTSLPDIGARVYWYLPVRLLCRYRYPTIEYIQYLDCPVLVAHSREDEMIPFAHARKLFEAAPEPKVFTELTGGHNDGEGFTETSYHQALDEFLTRYLGDLKRAIANSASSKV